MPRTYRKKTTGKRFACRTVRSVKVCIYRTGRPGTKGRRRPVRPLYHISIQRPGGTATFAGYTAPTLKEAKTMRDKAARRIAGGQRIV
jgi:hypothetical protein